MHPVLNARRRLAVYVLGWVPIGVLLAVGLGGGVGWAAAVALFVPLSVLHAFIGLSAWYLCRAFPIEHGVRLWRTLAVHLTAGALTSAIWVGLGQLWAAFLDAQLLEA